MVALYHPSWEAIVSSDTSSCAYGNRTVMRKSKRRHSELDGLMKDFASFCWGKHSISIQITNLWYLSWDRNIIRTNNLYNNFKYNSYSITLLHVPGKDLTVAETLSRAPTSNAQAVNLSLKKETNAYIQFVIESLPASERRIMEIKEC